MLHIASDEEAEKRSCEAWVVLGIYSLISYRGWETAHNVYNSTRYDVIRRAIIM